MGEVITGPSCLFGKVAHYKRGTSPPFAGIIGPMPTLTKAQRKAFQALHDAGVGLTPKQLSQWWARLGPVPGATAETIVEHGRALLPLLGKGGDRSAGAFSMLDRAAIGLARAGYPCPALPEVVLRLSGMAEWATEAPPGSSTLSEWEASHGVLLPDKTTERIAARAFEFVGKPGDQRFEDAASVGWFSMIETLVHAIRGGEVPADEIDELTPVIGSKRLATDLMGWLRSTGHNGTGREVAAFVRLAQPWYLAALVRTASDMASRYGNDQALDAICAVAAILLYIQVSGLVLAGLEGCKNLPTARATLHELLSPFLNVAHLLPSAPPARSSGR